MADTYEVTQVVSGKRTGSPAAPAPAPARHNKGQTEHILKTIAGYDSALTISAVFAALLYVWLLPAIASVAVGVLGFGGSDPVLYRLADSIAFGVVVAGIVSTGLMLHWFAQVRGNVPMLDRDKAVGAIPSALVSVKALAVAGLLVAAAKFVPGYGHLVTPSLIVAGLAATSGVVYYFVQSAKMLWRTSTSPTYADAALPRESLFAVIGWFVSLHLWWIERLVLRSIPWDLGHSLTLIVGGLVMGGVAVTGARFVGQVGPRQEARIYSLGASVGDQKTATPVSTQAIQQAWSESESLIGFDYH